MKQIKSITLSKRKYITIGIIFTTLLFAAISLGFYFNNYSKQYNKPSFETEYTEGKVEIDDIYGYSEMQFATEYRVGACGSPAADSEGVDVYFSNPQVNDVLLKCLLIDDENNTVGESGLINPGCYVKRIKFNKPMSPGTYEMTMKILGFEPETYYSKGIVNLKTYITIN